MSSANLAGRRMVSTSAYATSLRGSGSGSQDPYSSTSTTEIFTTLGVIDRIARSKKDESTTTTATTAAATTTTAAVTTKATPHSSTHRILPPVILVKLGPTIEHDPPFCWSTVGPTTADSTIAFPTGLMLPAIVAAKNVTVLEPDGDNTRRLRAQHSSTVSNTKESDTIKPDTTDIDTTTTTASSRNTDPTPTAQPTFLQGPRVYVHWGHPKCFAFGWEPMPPRD